MRSNRRAQAAENRLVPRESNISGGSCLDDPLAVLRKLANERLPTERNEESEDRKANQRQQAKNHLRRRVRWEFRTQRDQQHDACREVNHDGRDETQPYHGQDNKERRHQRPGQRRPCLKAVQQCVAEMSPVKHLVDEIDEPRLPKANRGQLSEKIPSQNE